MNDEDQQSDLTFTEVLSSVAPAHSQTPYEQRDQPQAMFVQVMQPSAMRISAPQCGQPSPSTACG